MIMANKRFVVKLSSEERKRLEAKISKGRTSAKIILKARILLKADQSEEGAGWTDEKICKALDTNIAMVTRVRSKLVNEGLDAVFARKKRETPPVQPIFDGERQAQLIALACSKPPPGYARWTLRLLADKVVERKIVATAHFNTVGRALKKTTSSRTSRNIGWFHPPPMLRLLQRWRMFSKFIRVRMIRRDPWSVSMRHPSSLLPKRARRSRYGLESRHATTTSTSATARHICSCCSRRSKVGAMSRSQSAALRSIMHMSSKSSVISTSRTSKRSSWCRTNLNTHSPASLYEA